MTTKPRLALRLSAVSLSTFILLQSSVPALHGATPSRPLFALSQFTTQAINANSLFHLPEMLPAAGPIGQSLRRQVGVLYNANASPASSGQSGGAEYNPLQSENRFLKNVLHHAQIAANAIGMSRTELADLLRPQREEEITIRWKGDDGDWKQATAYRIVHTKPQGAPSKGGIRLFSGLSRDDVRALSTEMSVKLVGNPMGGAKGGINYDKKLITSRGEMARMVRAYVHGMMSEVYERDGDLAFGIDMDVPAPDVNTSPFNDGTRDAHGNLVELNLMEIAVDARLEWMSLNGLRSADGVNFPAAFQKIARDAIGDGTATPFLDAVLAGRERKTDGNGRASLALLAAFTGKGVAKGGSQGRTDATGLGVAYSALEALRSRNLVSAEARTFPDTTVAVQGFGNVGQGAVKSFQDLGARVVAIAEWDGQPYFLRRDGGFPDALQAKMKKHLKDYGTLRSFTEEGVDVVDGVRDFWSLPVEILAPSAAENVINAEVAQKIRAKFIVEGANGPTTFEADEILESHHIPIVAVADVLANVGGVTVSHYEMIQNEKGENWTEQRVAADLRLVIQRNFKHLLAIQEKYGVSFRTAAYIAWLQEARGKRGYSFWDHLRYRFMAVWERWTSPQKVQPVSVPTTAIQRALNWAA